MNRNKLKFGTVLVPNEPPQLKPKTNCNYLSLTPLHYYIF